MPIDLEFNVWRKSQAIVTRNIQIDLCTNDHRRRLYEHAMETGGRMPGALDSNQAGAEASERELSSLETLRLFSQILDISDGIRRGDVVDREMRTQQEMGRIVGPPSSGSGGPMDMLY